MPTTAPEAYAILALPYDSPFGEVRKAFLRMARASHPDKNPGGTEYFKRIRAAYGLLDRLANPQRYAESQHSALANEASLPPLSDLLRATAGLTPQRRLIRMASLLHLYSPRGGAAQALLRLCNAYGLEPEQLLHALATTRDAF